MTWSRKLKNVYLPCLAGVVLLLTLGAKPALADSCSQGIFSGSSTVDLTVWSLSGFSGTVSVACTISGGNTVLTVSWVSGLLTPVGIDKFYWITDPSTGDLIPTVTGVDKTWGDPAQGTESADGFGTFTEGVEGGGNGTITGLVFTFAGTNITFTDLAAHVRFGPCSGWVAFENSNGGQGSQTNDCGVTVPEPSSATLLASGMLGFFGLAGLGLISRRKKQ